MSAEWSYAMDNQEMLTNVVSPMLKFTMNSNQLNYSAEKTSICGVIWNAENEHLWFDLECNEFVG